VVSSRPRPYFTPGKDPVPIVQEAGWAPGPVCIRTAYKNKRILIFSDSQAALKALSSPKVTSGLVAECLDALSVLASMNEVSLIRVPGHCGILGNEDADKLARQASATPLLGPEPALCSAREAIKNWTEHQHYSAWRDLPGLRHGSFLQADHVRKELITCLS